VCIGELRKAVTLREDVLELRKKGGQLTFIPVDLLNLGSAYLMLGELEKSEQYYNEAAIAAQGKDEIVVNVNNLGCFGQLYFYREEYEKARKCFEEAAKMWEKNTGGRINYYWVGFLAWTYIELNEFEKAKNLLDSQQKFILETGEKRLDMHLQVLRAMLFRAQKKYEKSIEVFDETLRDWESIGANVWSAYWFAKWPLFEYARACLERNQQGDREKAVNLLNRALEMFQKMSAKKDIEKTSALLEALHVPETHAQEKAISPESRERTYLQCSIAATPRELKIGESLELEIEVMNRRKEGAILLTKITEVIPEDFAVVRKPELYRVEGNCLIMREKQLEPSRTDVVKLVLTPKVQGTFDINPRIVYLDENGKEKTCKPEPVSITVKELGIKGWLKGER
jgi:tetratricopeptide (TPR) repeat protein